MQLSGEEQRFVAAGAAQVTFRVLRDHCNILTVLIYHSGNFIAILESISNKIACFFKLLAIKRYTVQTKF